MNHALVAKYLGVFTMVIALLILAAAPVAVIYGEWDALGAIFWSVGVGVMAGIGLYTLGRNASTALFEREALALVSLPWFMAAIVGGLPFIFLGVLGPVDAFFETMSGFTTTGATVMQDIEAAPKSLLFWRSLTQWLGGIGIVVLFLAVLPYFGAGGKQMFKTQASGPEPRALTPRIKETAYIMLRIYGGMSVALTVALMLAGMSLYDAVCHMMATLSTGGFSPKQASIGHYDSVAVELILIAGMLLGGTSFALLYRVTQKDWLAPLRDAEWRLYVGIIIVASAGIAWELVFIDRHFTFLHALRESLFSIVSLMTGTGFVTEDYDTWPSLSHVTIFLLMFAGGCAGSTTGGIKILRFLLLAKIAYWRVESMFRPKTVRAIRLGTHVVDENVRKTTHVFFVLFVTIFAFGSLFMAGMGLPLESAMSAVASTLGNVGPGLGMVGPTEDYSFINAPGKLFLSLCMAIGRLEIFALLVLFVPSFWKR